MVVKIIGSHGGVAPGFRATSFLIDGKLLIDAGSVASGIAISDQVLIDHILISHSHLDHISDLAFICDNCFGLKNAPFEVYCHTPVTQAIKNHLLNDIIWPDFTKLPNQKKPTMRFHDFLPEEVITLGDYEILPVEVNHQGGAVGFIIQKDDQSIVFTQDTGATDRIWELANKRSNVVAIFSEISFPNRMDGIAVESQHHTPDSFAKEIEKMPADVPIFVGHLKPNFRDELVEEIQALDNSRLTILESDNSNFSF